MSPGHFGGFSFGAFGAPPVLNSYLYNQPGRGSLLGSNQTSIFGGDQVSPAAMLQAMQGGYGPGVTTGQMQDPTGANYAAPGALVATGLSDSGTVSQLATPPSGFFGIPWLGWGLILGATALVLTAGHFMDDRRLIEKTP